MDLWLPLILRREHCECDLLPEELLTAPAEKVTLFQGFFCPLFLLGLNPQTIAAPWLMIERPSLGCFPLRSSPVIPSTTPAGCRRRPSGFTPYPLAQDPLTERDSSGLGQLLRGCRWVRDPWVLDLVLLAGHQVGGACLATPFLGRSSSHPPIIRWSFTVFTPCFQGSQAWSHMA